MIGNWITSKEQSNLVIATSTNNKVGALDKAGKDRLIEILGKWRIYLGINREVYPEELIIIALYIQEHFGDLTVEEIEVAMTVSMLGKLDYELERLDAKSNPYGNFSVFYVNNILLAFKAYRSTNMNIILENRQAHMRMLSNKEKRSPEFLMNQMKDVFIQEHDNYYQNGEMMDFFNVCYTFLRNTKPRRLDISKKLIDEAMEYGRKKAISEMKNDKSIKSALLAYTDDTDNPVIKRFARNYCVQQFFDKVNIKTLVDSFKPEEFAK